MEKRINKLLAVCAAGAVVFGVIAFLMRGAPHSAGAGGSFTFPLQEYLDLNLQRLDVRLVLYDGDEITVEYKNDRPLEMEVGDNSLVITESDKFVVSLFAGKEADFGITVYLPRTVYRDVDIYTGTGDVDVEGIDCKKLSVITESGDIKINNMGYQAKISTTSGNVDLDMGAVVRGTEVLNREGDIKLTLPHESSVAVDFQTITGYCKTDLMNGEIIGNYVYAFNGGKKQISVTAERGTLYINERK